MPANETSPCGPSCSPAESGAGAERLLIRLAPSGPIRPAPSRSRLLDGDGILLDVFFHGGAARAALNVVERLGVLDAVAPAQGPAAGEEELPDVVAVGRGLVVAQERQFLAALGQFG